MSIRKASRPSRRPASDRVLLQVRVYGRKTDRELGRTRSHLLPAEVKALIKAAGSTGRHRARDALMIRMAALHGFRVSELIALRWADVNLAARLLYVTRNKSGTPSQHNIEADEIRALKALQKATGDSAYVFLSERGEPLSRSTVNKMVKHAGELARIPFPVTPHMLRHACGYTLANQGVPTRNIQRHLGHVSIEHTARYTALADKPIKGVTWGF